MKCGSHQYPSVIFFGVQQDRIGRAFFNHDAIGFDPFGDESRPCICAVVRLFPSRKDAIMQVIGRFELFRYEASYCYLRLRRPDSAARRAMKPQPASKSEDCGSTALHQLQQYQRLSARAQK
jgi:hypothetical protein